MPTANTVVGWTVVAAVAGGYYWATNVRKNKTKKSLGKQMGEAVEQPKSQKAKKARKDTGVQSGSDNTKAKKSKKATPKVEPAVASVQIEKDSKAKDENDDQEFVRQMQNAKTGTIAAAKSQQGARQKSVKQSRAQEKALAEASSDNATAPSSTTGGDADDDQSPVNSPDLAATSQPSPVTNGISDMLEQAAAGPSILRVTSPTNPSPPKKANSNTATKPAEMTKKQRQNKKKTEDAKLAREAEEQERKALMEKQRRTAREAEGRAAKDGSTFMAAKAPSTSVWTDDNKSAANGTKSTSAASPVVKPLDTYESSNKSTTTSNPAPMTEAEEWYDHEMTNPSAEWTAQIEAQEARCRELGLDPNEIVKVNLEDSKEWKMVMAKERKNKARKGNNSNDAAISDKQQDYHALPKKNGPTGPGQKYAATLSYYNEGEDEAVTDHMEEVQNSEWEVAP